MTEYPHPELGEAVKLNSLLTAVKAQWRATGLLKMSLKKHRNIRYEGIEAG